MEEGRGGGSLGLLVDDAAGGAAAELDAGWAFEDFDLLVVEGVAIVGAEVADAVEEDVVAGGEAADGEVVALGAELARGHGYAGDVAEGVAEGGVLLLLEDELGDDGDGLRGVEKRLGELGHVEGVGNVGGDGDLLGLVEADGEGGGKVSFGGGKGDAEVKACVFKE